MNDYRINQNYAKALYLLASDLGQTKVVFDDMKLVGEVFKENHILNTVFNNPVIKEEKKINIAKELFSERISATSLAFVLYVVKKRRAVNLGGISRHYLDYYREKNNIVLANLMTAVEVNPEHVERIRDEVAKFTHKDVEMNAFTTNKMLGSFYLSFDTYLYDARLLTKIAKMRKEFRKNDYESRL
ncbi:MAG: ATP synthase F1 subunit delta [Bacteroidales bacterium]|nr:ATP synthase F1 subunit delta [Candidatus Colimorpha pelethequi]